MNGTEFIRECRLKLRHNILPNENGTEVAILWRTCRGWKEPELKAEKDWWGEHREALTHTAATARVGERAVATVETTGKAQLRQAAAKQAAARRAVAAGKAPLPAPRIAAPAASEGVA